MNWNPKNIANSFKCLFALVDRLFFEGPHDSLSILTNPTINSNWTLDNWGKLGEVVDISVTAECVFQIILSIHRFPFTLIAWPSQRFCFQSSFPLLGLHLFWCHVMSWKFKCCSRAWIFWFQFNPPKMHPSTTLLPETGRQQKENFQNLRESPRTAEASGGFLKVPERGPHRN